MKSDIFYKYFAFSSLPLGIPPPSKSAEYMKIVFRIGFYSLAAYGVYRFAQKISSKQILGKLISSK